MQLRDAKLELALMVKPSPAMLRGLAFDELARDDIRVAVGRKHPLAQRRAIKLADVAREPLIALSRTEYPDYYESFDALFASAKLKPNIKEEHESISSLIASVEACSGVALVSESLACIAGSRLRLLALSPKAPPLVIGAAWSKTRRSEAAASKFLECAKRAATEGD